MSGGEHFGVDEERLERHAERTADQLDGRRRGRQVRPHGAVRVDRRARDERVCGAQCLHRRAEHQAGGDLGAAAQRARLHQPAS